MLAVIIAVLSFCLTLSHTAVADDVRRMPNAAEIRAYCANPVPGEKRDVDNNCAERAARGECSGGTAAANATRREQCHCSCSFTFTYRIQTCCRVVGGATFDKDCLQLCRYNVTNAEMSSALGFKCFPKMNVWVYCAWDTFDGRQCCESAGVSKGCSDIFCQGDLTCDFEVLNDNRNCTRELGGVTNACMFMNVDPLKPKWSATRGDKCAGQ